MPKEYSTHDATPSARTRLRWDQSVRVQSVCYSSWGRPGSYQRRLGEAPSEASARRYGAWQRPRRVKMSLRGGNATACPTGLPPSAPDRAVATGAHKAAAAERPGLTAALAKAHDGSYDRADAATSDVVFLVSRRRNGKRGSNTEPVCPTLRRRILSISQRLRTPKRDRNRPWAIRNRLFTWNTLAKLVDTFSVRAGQGVHIG